MVAAVDSIALERLGDTNLWDKGRLLISQPLGEGSAFVEVGMDKAWGL